MGSWIIKITLTGLSSVFAFASFSATPYEIKDEVGEYMFMYEDLEYLEDNNYSIEEVSQGELSKKFLLNKLFAPHNFNKENAYWIRIRIKGNPSSKKKWLIEFFDQTTDYIEAYIPIEKSLFIRQVQGDNLPFYRRLFQHKNFQFEIPNNTSHVLDYYFKVKSRNHINIIIVIRSLNHFIYYGLNEYFLYGIFYGMILIVVIYNLLMYLAIKEIQFLSYILFVLSLGLYFMCIDGIAYQYLWPDYPDWNNKAFGFVVVFGIIFLLIFTKQFLHLRSRYPLLNTIINYTIAVRITIFLIALWYPKEGYNRLLEIIPLSIAFYSGIYSFIKGYKPARFFVMAFGFLYLGFLIRILINLDIDIIPASIVSHYGINLAFACQMWTLSFALVDKVRIINSTKNKALKRIIQQHEVNEMLKDKVNRELEEEVRKRTFQLNEQKKVIEVQNLELQQTNEVLRLQGEEIKRINSKLDKDNFSLKNSIKEKMLERAASKNMDYQEFKVIFPDEFSCLRYLDQQKRKRGFLCKKCNNDKDIAGKGKLDRRCSRCGYNESPTAFTLFHGVKFSLEKAFYILHLIITERNDLTFEELSQILDLRKSTCWKFKTKVTSIIKKHGKVKEYLEHWENLIFYSEELEEKTEVK